MDDVKQQLLDAAIAHVPFEGWSEATFNAAVTETGVNPTVARALCPRGAFDLAVAYHKRGDATMRAALAAEDLTALRYRDRVARAVRLRIEAADREVVRRGSALMSLPQNAPEGARLIWGTADAIWTALGDTSDDVNWYSKRAILSGVYGSTVLYWLGDNSEAQAATWAFLDRRIDDVMRFEKVKAQVRDSKVLGPFAQMAERALSGVKAPLPTDDAPGRWRG